MFRMLWNSYSFFVLYANIDGFLPSVGNKNFCSLLVVGGGNLLPKLKKFAILKKMENKIIFAGEVPRPEIKNYYAAGDIFVYGSKSETQGMIITEAMYVGLPIVAVNATGASSLILNNGNGFLVEESEKDFSEAVGKLVKDKSLREKFSENSRKIARTQFTSLICADKMLEVYEEAIRNFKI